MEQLLQKLEGYADEKALFILAGSIPNGVDKNIYAEITKRALNLLLRRAVLPPKPGNQIRRGAFTTIGTKPPARKLVDELMKQVEIEKI